MALSDKISTAKSVMADTKSRIIVVILAIIVVVVLAIVYVKFKRSEVAPAGLGSSLAGTPNISSIPGLGKPTREYAKLQEQQNQELAAEAARKGTSAIPTIVRTTYVDTGVSSDLSKGSGAASTEGCSVEELKRARASGVDVTELRCRGCSLAALKAAGYTAGELRNAGFGAKDLKDAGFSANDLKNAGFDPGDLKDAGFGVSELSNAGFSAGELKKAGYGDSDLKKAGFSDDAIKAAADNCSIRKIQEARNKGTGAAILRKLGCGVAALKTAGYTAAQLKVAGFSAGELRNTGFSAKTLKDAGFSAQELKTAGFNAGDLSEAGFTPDELSAAGYTQGDLMRAGVIASLDIKDPKEVNVCSVENLRKAREDGVLASKFIKLGCSVRALKAAGYAVTELKAAGLSAAELHAVGFPKDLLKKAGFKIAEPEKPDEIKADGVPKSLQDNLEDNIDKLKDDQIAGMSGQELADFVRQQQAMMMMQANQLFSSWAPIPAQQYVEGEKPKDAHAVSKSKLSSEQKKEMELANNDVFKAGTIIFATLDTEVNSDETTPVMATVVHGSLKGSKVIGNFQRADKKILLQFSVLSVPKLTQSIGINAVAVDPDTAKTAMASSVDNHYMLRYGTMLASSFVSGVGQAFQSSGSEIKTDSGGGSVATMPTLTTAQKMVVGFGNMAQQLNTAMAPNINKPPTVKINAGISVGLLLMADLMVPKK